MRQCRSGGGFTPVAAAAPAGGLDGPEESLVEPDDCVPMKEEMAGVKRCEQLAQLFREGESTRGAAWFQARTGASTGGAAG